MEVEVGTKKNVKSILFVVGGYLNKVLIAILSPPNAQLEVSKLNNNWPEVVSTQCIEFRAFDSLLMACSQFEKKEKKNKMHLLFVFPWNCCCATKETN